MTTVLLVRHGRTTANADGLLAGWTPGITLDEQGREQTRALATRLGPLPLAAVVSSPLERCVETADLLVAGREGLTVRTDERLAEVRYGDWTGQSLKALAKEPLWKVVQAHPSAATFPGEDGESLRETQSRAVTAVRDWNARLADEHGPGAIYAICSHGDVIKSVIADALGLHLDLFQRIVVDPCSVTAISYTETRPFLIRLNDTGRMDGLLPPRRRRSRRTGRRGSRTGDSDSVVGGGAGA